MTLIFPASVIAQTAPDTAHFEGKVEAILETAHSPDDPRQIEHQVLQLRLSSGDQKRQVITVKNALLVMGVPSVQFQTYAVGDTLKIIASDVGNGSIEYSIDGKSKRPGLLTLGLLFVAVVLIVGKVWGALSLVGLVVSFLVIFQIIIPLIIKGYNPVFSAVIGSIIIVPITFYISHGFSLKTHVGVAATFIGLLITGVLATYFVDAIHLTGFASEEAGFLQVQRQGTIDIKGLLLAGVIIGTLGILDDVTVGQSSTVQQLAKANKKMKGMVLFRQGMIVGQDHISSMVNTLVLVYAGSALPLLLLFFDSQRSFLEIVESELIAEEIVRMLVGSIGLMIAAPLATIMAAYVFSNYKVRKALNAQTGHDEAQITLD